MRKTCILFINKSVGKLVAKTLIKAEQVNVKAVYIVDVKNTVDEELENLLEKHKVLTGIGSSCNTDGMLEQIGEVDFFISVYWPHLIDGKCLKYARDTINFHPALLPKNRGWYPHVHNIIDQSTPGVSLHRIAEKVDGGDIWVQKTVEIKSTDLASDLHSRLMSNIYELFEENWKSIFFGRIKAVPQDQGQANYKSKYYFDKLDLLDLTETVKVGDFLRFLRARSLEERGFAHFLDEEGDKVYINLRLSKET